MTLESFYVGFSTLARLFHSRVYHNFPSPLCRSIGILDTKLFLAVASSPHLSQKILNSDTQTELELSITGHA